MVKMLDLRSKGRELNSRSGRCQVVTAIMRDCWQTDKPSRI